MTLERGELISAGMGVVGSLTILGLELGVRVNEVLASQAPVIRNVETVAFLVAYVGYMAALIMEFPRLNRINGEAERASMRPPTLSNGPQSL